jgi:DNA-binding NtrC family response regulator
VARRAGRILIVDDDVAICTSLAGALSSGGVEVRTAADTREALLRIAESPPDLVLSDVRLPGLDGVELLKLLRERAPATDVILMTAYDDMPTVVAAMREGALDFLVKPLDLRALRSIIDKVFEDRRARQLAARGPDDPREYALDELVGRGPRMIQIFKIIGQAAASQATVLVRGESGTGKELIARAIHFNSSRKAEPFVAVNCASLPATLLESELFGHTRGAFTGAVGARRGRFALASGGTIFLDEIGDTSLEFQSKLLRVLQEKEFFPVGAERGEKTNARVLAATHRNLEDLVTAGKFRQDLYYRLRVVEVVLPPLRERLDDLDLLTDHLVARLARASGVATPVVGPQARDALRLHSWPGNVRELENCLARAVVLASGAVIRPEHLAIDHPRGDLPTTLGSLDEMERAHVIGVLEATGGHKGKAAEILGVSRPRLNRLLRHHGLE